MQSINEKSTSWNWKLLLKILLTGAMIYWVWRKIDFNEIINWVATVPVLFTICAVLLFNISKIVGALRLNFFFRADAIELTPIENIALYYKGMFYNLTLPGGIGGDGYKVYYLNKKLGVPIKKALSGIVWDRVSGALAILFLCILLSVFLPVLNDFSILRILIAIVLLLIFPAFYKISLFLFPSYKSITARANLAALGIQVLQGLVAVIILLGMHIHTSGILEYVIVFFVSSLATILPITIGGLGIRELVFIAASQYTSVEADKAVAFSLIFFAISSVSSMAGAFVSGQSKKPVIP